MVPNRATNNTRVIVMVGTRKGGFIFSSDLQRKTWQTSDIQFKSWKVMHMALDKRDGRMHAALAHDVYGSVTQYSDDLGHTWKQASQVPGFSRPSLSGRPLSNPDEAVQPEKALDKPENLLKVWNITPGLDNQPGLLYAGAEPAALFRSTDRGETWTLVESLYDHPHRSNWFPGAGGLCLHTILPDPSEPRRIYVAISTGGCYRSDDGGETWSPRNKNVRADFLPEKFPEYGHCVHRMALHPNQPDVLYQQNHCGVYRSDNRGDVWIDIGEGRLPGRFGFPIAVHPHDPNTIYIVPEESDEYRMSLGGQFAVWRSHDKGETWERLTTGLPNEAYLVALRHALATDPCERAGLYVGTTTGQIFYSRDSGDHWETLVDFLPPIYSIETAVIQG